MTSPVTRIARVQEKTRRGRMDSPYRMAMGARATARSFVRGMRYITMEQSTTMRESIQGGCM